MQSHAYSCAAVNMSRYRVVSLPSIVTSQQLAHIVEYDHESDRNNDQSRKLGQSITISIKINKATHVSELNIAMHWPWCSLLEHFHHQWCQCVTQTWEGTIKESCGRWWAVHNWPIWERCKTLPDFNAPHISTYVVVLHLVWVLWSVVSLPSKAASQYRLAHILECGHEFDDNKDQSRKLGQTNCGFTGSCKLNCSLAPFPYFNAGS